jgi:hypothetical protein
MTAVREFLEKHLQGIFDYDLALYAATTVADLGLYEWYITPHRIDGIPFHDFLMTEAARAGAVPLTGEGLLHSTVPPSGQPARVRFDLANYREQQYGETAIASYTILLSTSSGAGVTVRSYNESRVMVHFPEGWKVVHVHKSPSWNAPFQPPNSRA